MKRDVDGNNLPESVLCNDLQEKIRALINFSTESCSYDKYRDDFLVYLKPDDTSRGRHNIQFFWFCQKFVSRKDTYLDDSRNHEGLLRKHFAKYNVLIHKNDLNWDVVVSTPRNPPGIHRVSIPASDTPS